MADAPPHLPEASGEDHQEVVPAADADAEVASAEATTSTDTAAETDNAESVGGDTSQVEVINLSDADINPFEVLGFDLSGNRTLTIDDFMAIPTADVMWEDLEPAQRKAYELVGFDAGGRKHTEMRLTKLLDGCAETPWSEMSQEARDAAIGLGCDQLGIRHEMGRLATVSNRLLLKDPDIKRKKWAQLTPGQQVAATRLGHDNGGSIWNVRVDREWCKNGVSPNSSLQNPFALPKGPESLLRIARNMGIEITREGARMRNICLDTDDDVIAAVKLLLSLIHI